MPFVIRGEYYTECGNETTSRFAGVAQRHLVSVKERCGVQEWEWPKSADGTLRLGTLGASSTRRVSAALVNRGVTALCVLELLLALPGAQLGLPHCAEPVQPHPPPEPHSCVSIPYCPSLVGTVT